MKGFLIFLLFILIIGILSGILDFSLPELTPEESSDLIFRESSDSTRITIEDYANQVKVILYGGD
jgi:hypothetical protein